LRVFKILENRNSIGKELILKCNNHNLVTKIKVVKDFDNVPEGGCK